MWSSMVSVVQRAIAEVKQLWSVIGWVNKNYLELLRASVPLIPVVFAVVSTHQPALGPRGGLWHILLMCNP
jgi:hypothetical protein